MAKPFVKRDTFLPFSRPTIRQVEIDEVVDTLRSGWITTGPKAERFEKDFAAYVEAPEVLAVSSATGGLHIGLIALGVKPGDEVIITPMTWAATSNMVEALGGTSVFVEIDPDTLQIDPAAVEAAVTDRTVGIIPVHFGGAPCDMDPLLEIARRHSLWIFEDAAHGVGTLYKGKHVGLFD
ncbi:MAG TPA: aminotransferase class I/II-fold pyridoxal phosphate-dependent enzyme, partial [Thermoanaerobaculia bacterium]|nr:aminotransferase class I/II-fold pyridoxal phosphate-dependent enzyme [Thermoanaerobaculia bacterium]